MKISVDWLKDYLGSKASSETLAHDLTMAGLEVEKIEPANGDTRFVTEITTNRPDWLSHIGVARELYAIRGGKFRIPSSKKRKPAQTDRKFQVAIKAPKLCPYYSATLLEGVGQAPTPDFMKRRLDVCGIRSIHLIVDITNYVLLEWGQPLHAFDADRLKGNTIYTRRAEAGEEMVAIDEMTYVLTRDDLVIADEGGAIAIGGVMGGQGSEVSDRTKNILLESAYFAPFTVRATSRRLGLTSESSYRFERRVDPNGVDAARERAIDLILKYAGAERVSAVFRKGKAPVQTPTLSFDSTLTKKLLGISIPFATTKNLLKRLGLTVSGTVNKLKVKTPSFRCDLKDPVDLVEEVARLHGFHKIAETMPMITAQEPEVDAMLSLEEKVRGLCVGLGLQEVITFSLVEMAPLKELGLDTPDWTHVINPQNKELSLLRPSLLPGMLRVVQHNLHVGESDVRLFEVGNSYLNKVEGRFSAEQRMCSFAIAGDSGASWLVRGRKRSFYDLKGVTENFCSRLNLPGVQAEESSSPYFEPGQGVTLRTQSRVIGSYGTVLKSIAKKYGMKQQVYFAEFSLEVIVDLLQKAAVIRAIPKFPASPRDLTVILDDTVRAKAVCDEINRLGRALVQGIDIFDFFKSDKLAKGKKSLSFRIQYQAKDRTLQNEEVNELHFSIIESLKAKYGAELPAG